MGCTVTTYKPFGKYAEPEMPFLSGTDSAPASLMPAPLRRSANQSHVRSNWVSAIPVWKSKIGAPRCPRAAARADAADRGVHVLGCGEARRLPSPECFSRCEPSRAHTNRVSAIRGGNRNRRHISPCTRPSHPARVRAPPTGVALLARKCA